MFNLWFALFTTVASFAQFYHLNDIPGIHFDEAWQGVFAHRIAYEKGFYPLTAMSDYTWPIVHYFLAASFKFFGPTLGVMRLTIGIINIFSLVLTGALFVKIKRPHAALIFLMLGSILPLNVHLHRFYIETTFFFGLCFASILWGAYFHFKQKAYGTWLIAAAVLLGTLSHILFLSVYLALFIFTFSRKENLKSRALLKTLGLLGVAFALMTMHMGLALKKITPILMTAGLFSVSALCFFPPNTFSFFGKKISAVLQSPKMLLLPCLALPFLFIFLFLQWNGFWPYAQATGQLEPRWIPLNLLVLLFCLGFHWKNAKHDFMLNQIFIFFIWVFAFTTALILKHAPKYFMVPSLLLCIYCALALERSFLKFPKWSAVLCVSFFLFNSFHFFQSYVLPFERGSTTSGEFRLWRFHDSARDFRPYQKAFTWLQSQGCTMQDLRILDARAQLPLEFLFLSTSVDQKISTQNCPWSQGTLFFFSLPEYDFNRIQLIKSSPEWGDLAFGIWRK